MTDPLPSGPRREAQTGAEDDARIEQLLVTGLDHYFAGEFEAAINLWTRVLFLDRNHDRARAYIDRARSAQAEQHRVSEALVHQGLEAFDRGEVARARALLSDALDQGASHDLALGVLGRIDRLDVGQTRSPRRAAADRQAPRPAEEASVGNTRSGSAARCRHVDRPGLGRDARGRGRALLRHALNLAGFWPGAAPVADRPFTATVDARAAAGPAARGELPGAGARPLFASGKLRDALRAVDRVPVGDSLRQDADRLRGEIQRELLAVASAEASPAISHQPTGATTRMKCPKCGYLGFETTDRCRNCQYDFSLAPFAIEPELALQSGDRMPNPTADFELPGMTRIPTT